MAFKLEISPLVRNDCVFHSGCLAVGYESQEKCCSELKSRQPERDLMLQVKLQAVMSFMRQQSQIFGVHVTLVYLKSLIQVITSLPFHNCPLLLVNSETPVDTVLLPVICSAKSVLNNIWEHKKKKKEIYDSCKDYYYIKGFL